MEIHLQRINYNHLKNTQVYLYFFPFSSSQRHHTFISDYNLVRKNSYPKKVKPEKQNIKSEYLLLLDTCTQNVPLKIMHFTL